MSPKYHLMLLAIFIAVPLASPQRVVMAGPQQASDAGAEPADDQADAELATPERVDVLPVTRDDDISERLARILNATESFNNVEVRTDEGVVFLSGIAESEQHRQWAEDLALRTSDVVAVVNELSLPSRPIWDIAPAIDQLRELGREFVRMLPLIAVGFLIIVLAWLAAKLAAAVSRKITERRIDSLLLQQVIASIVAVLVMLIGVYIALKVSGLTRLAVTVLGGTGLVGLALGFAFRDIAENYLASVLISLNRPFSVGDLIELNESKGFVRRVTTRGTLLLTIEGNHVQIPNSTVYKSVIVNYSSSPRIRKEFVLGIGYEDSVAEAQEIVLSTLENHESVLSDPAPLVLVDTLGAATVNLKVYFWLDGNRFDAASVCSALMRRAKTALAEARISMPDEAREVVFPKGVPIITAADDLPTSIDRDTAQPLRSEASTSERKTLDSDKAQASEGEGGLQNTSEKIQQHALDAERDEAENLID